MSSSKFILLLVVILEIFIPIADACICEILLSDYYCCSNGIYCCQNGYVCSGSICIHWAAIVVPCVIAVIIIISIVACCCCCCRANRNANPGVIMQPTAGQPVGYAAQPGAYPPGTYPQTGTYPANFEPK